MAFVTGGVSVGMLLKLYRLVPLAVLGVALQVALLFALRRPGLAARSGFMCGLSLSLAVVALVATVWTPLPVVSTSLCP